MSDLVQWCCIDGQDAICEVLTGAVGVLKGLALLPPTVLHRSPPLSGVGPHRLMLMIDLAWSC